MWCENCQHETHLDVCELCGSKTEAVVPTDVFWCAECQTPIIRNRNDADKDRCPLCNGKAKYLAADIRVVFPEERLLLELMLDKPLAYKECSVWANNSRYYIDGKSVSLTSKMCSKHTPEYLLSKLQEYHDQNQYDVFDQFIERFIRANSTRFYEIVNEAHQFIQEQASKLPIENIVLSFSGGKDSTVTADLVTKALQNPSLVHIFGNTTLQIPLRLEYANRFRDNHPLAIFKTAKNNEQEFMWLCEDIGPPARMMRWCCSMFKTGPITRVLTRYYRDTRILTFYGIRRDESTARSKYNRVEDDAESVKIQKQP